MAYFKYKLLEPTGKASSGTVALPYKDTTSAILHLERDDSTIIYIKKIGPLLSPLLDIRDKFRKKLPRKFQAEFFNNLSMMLKAGMTLNSALEESGRASEYPDFERDLLQIIADIQGGTSFSEAAARYQYIFPTTIVFLIQIGEETGQLDHMLLKASEHLRNIQQIVSDTKQALMYPMLVVVALGGGMVFWFYYVVPKILSLFKEMDVALPPLTVFLLSLSEFLQNHVLEIILIPILLFIILTSLYNSHVKARKVMQAVMLKIPIVGQIISTSTVAFISEYFSLLLNSGIDIIHTLVILKKSIKNEVYKEKLEEIRESLRKGVGIAESFAEADIFESFIVRMINVGEISGSLPTQLTYIADSYRNKLNIMVSTIGKMIEPIVLIIAGAMLTVIIVGLFLPLYDLISKVN